MPTAAKYNCVWIWSCLFCFQSFPSIDANYKYSELQIWTPEITRASRSTCTPRKHQCKMTILMHMQLTMCVDYSVNDTSTSFILKKVSGGSESLRLSSDVTEKGRSTHRGVSHYRIILHMQQSKSPVPWS